MDRVEHSPLVNMSSPSIRDTAKPAEDHNKNVVSSKGELSFPPIAGYDSGSHSPGAEKGATAGHDAKGPEKAPPAVEVSPISPHFHEQRSGVGADAKPSETAKPQEKVPAVAVSPLYGLRGTRPEPNEKMPANLGIIG
jgi:hypothetical protein